MKVALFDCDSTLTSIEGIDALAAQNGVGAEVAILTAQAMNGEIPYESVPHKRLALTRPTRQQEDALGQLYVENIVLGAREAVRLLKMLGYQVGIVSGGYQQSIEVLARSSDIDLDWIYAVQLCFDDEGGYRGTEDPYGLAAAEGKIGVIETIRSLYQPSRIVMTGDGVTDMVCAPHVDVFVGYGGVVVRKNVRAGAEYYSDHPDLMRVLEFLLTPEELRSVASSDPEHYSRIIGKPA